MDDTCTINVERRNTYKIWVGKPQRKETEA